MAEAKLEKQITPGIYLCWQNNQSSPGGKDLIGEVTIKGNTYERDNGM